MRRAQLAGGAGGFVLMSALVVHSSSAAFTATTDNADNSWVAGSVHLRDGDAGTALFDEHGLSPGHTGTRCLVVTYDGDIAADVRLRAALTGGSGLGAHLDVVVRRGTGAAADCSDFAAVETAYSGTLDDLAARHGAFSTGVGTWAPATSATSATYAFRWTLRSDDAAQGKAVSAAFTWEARSR